MSTEGLVLEFTFAHFSDVHLGPLPSGAVWRDFALKRVLGGLSWGWRRHHIHVPQVADALVADVLAHTPDHVAFTGDLVNISAVAEFDRGAHWFAKVGSADHVSFTPGNHDAYVPVSYEDGLKKFAPYMTGDFRRGSATSFPFVRLRRNVASVGLNSAVPQSLTRAGGTLGPDQLRLLAQDLRDLKARGFFRVVMLHHPPFPGLAIERKALTDAPELADVLKLEGAELILHGHNHQDMFNMLSSGDIPAHGVASASSCGRGHHAAATWHRYAIDRSKGKWRVNVTVRSYDPATRLFKTTREFVLHDATTRV